MKAIDITTPLGALRLTENDVTRNFEGGRVVLIADNSDPDKPQNTPDLDLLSEDMKIVQITVMISYRKNAAMQDWPQLGTDENKARRFTLHITEAPAEKLSGEAEPER